MKAGKQGPHGEPRTPPAGLMQALGWDLSPLRPEEHDRTQAARWIAAVTMVNAYRDGVADADAEAQ